MRAARSTCWPRLTRTTSGSGRADLDTRAEPARIATPFGDRTTDVYKRALQLGDAGQISLADQAAPPSLIVHGDRDRPTGLADADALYSRMARAGSESTRRWTSHDPVLPDLDAGSFQYAVADLRG